MWHTTSTHIVKPAGVYAQTSAVVDECRSSRQYNPCSNYYPFPYSIPFANSTLKPAVHGLLPIRGRSRCVADRGDEVEASNRNLSCGECSTVLCSELMTLETFSTTCISSFLVFLLVKCTDHK